MSDVRPCHACGMAPDIMHEGDTAAGRTFLGGEWVVWCDACEEVFEEQHRSMSVRSPKLRLAVQHWNELQQEADNG